jgi:hypothetical protein
LAIHSDPSKLNQNIYEALKNDIIREKAANNELVERIRELSTHQAQDKSAREGAEMKLLNQKSVFCTRKRKIEG